MLNYSIVGMLLSKAMLAEVNGNDSLADEIMCLAAKAANDSLSFSPCALAGSTREAHVVPTFDFEVVEQTPRQLRQCAQS